jgi:CheY-like chemotaxis protein/DNA-binding CsgD family transcriptional regulator
VASSSPNTSGGPMPSQHDEQAPIPNDVDLIQQALARTTVLIVDDAVDSLSVLHAALNAAGFTVLIAPDGIQAIAQVAHTLPDVILMDAVMPGLDGFETCKRIKQLPDAAHVPVIFMTGLSDTEDVVKGLAAGGVDYATKPIQIEALVARIQVHLRNARLLRGAQTVLRATGKAIFAANRNGKLLWQTPEAYGLMATVGLLGADNTQSGLTSANDSSPTHVLPDELAHWLQTLAVGSTTTWRNPAQDHRVNIACIAYLENDEWLLSLQTDPLLHATQLVSQRHGLSLREAEVLYWTALGKSNRDIADILMMQPRTVGKHLEKIFIKLGVESRAAATSFVMRLANAG